MRTCTFIVFFVVVCVALAFASTGKEASNETQTQEAGVRAAVKLWEQSVSGFPMNCRRVVDLFASDGVAEVPAGQTIIPAGRKMFTHCEQKLLPHFTHIETFADITGLQVSFERTVLLVTATSCRMVSKGITSITYDKDFKIKVLKDYVNVEEFTTGFNSCQFPTLPNEEDKQSKRDGEKEL